MLKISAFILLVCFSPLINSQTHELSMISKMNGQVTLDDGQTVTFWGYGFGENLSEFNKVFLPGPELRFNVGDTLIINFLNDSPEDHTIHWHGLDVDQANDGVPHTSTAVPQGILYTYTFVCKEPGAFIYHCHVLTTLHLAMGMYGMFVIDPLTENQLYNHSGKYTKDYNYLLSEMDISWNSNPLSPGPFYQYSADYGMVNGWAGQQIEDNQQSIEATVADSIGIRLANTGYGRIDVIFPTQLITHVYGSDGREVPSFITDTLSLFPGERFGVVAYPQSDFKSNIQINYYDLNTESLYYSNSIGVEIDEDLSIFEEEKDNIKVFPNPFNEALTIVNPSKPVLAKIVDLNGRIVWKGMLNKGENKLQLTLKKGLYMLNFREKVMKIIRL